MGCISSKVMARSLSYRQEMKWGSQGTAQGKTALPEDMLVPRKGSNRFLALVCAATTMTDTCQSENLTFESPILVAEIDDNDAIIKSHPGPVVNKDRSTDGYELSPDPPKRSRSWHSFPLEEIPPADTENCMVADGALAVTNKGAIRLRSFHTVEEYDRLLERIWYVSFSEKGNMEEDSGEKDTLTSPENTTNQTEEENVDSQETSQPSKGNTSLVGESNASTEMIKEGFPGESSSPGTKSDDTKEPKLSSKEDAPQERPVPLKVKGLKRKSIARGLDALDIPGTFELPAIASLREWLPEGHVFSPGGDPTPKFGSCTGLTDNITNKSSGEIIFDNELVIALEEQLQHLKAEEAAILKQITSTREVTESTGVKEEIAIT